ncbi:Ig-like domain-containing protein [Micromonospora sp. WMMD1102]|uniref:Ig-like domain-containing protein n=1 Tax=Micromonospora sp. WMMD1102 TaxID=3016105 RepID=UPI0024152667|nr:Ig-like domain-containing protein [Micromonospora sp. WMMD1102]MDG4789585.1 Ig-like domain-containing protein [Micromonospora sp. WMMD1102]
MWSRRIVAVLAVTAVVATGPIPPAARAGGPGEPILSDFDNDGTVDRAVLGAIYPNLCSLIIQYGTSPGVYLPPVAYAYQRPGGGELGTDCPDIGTAFDADDDQFNELWLAWSDSVPASVPYNRIAVDHDFDTITTFTSPLANPSYLGAEDFTGNDVRSPFAVGPGGYYTSILVDGVAQLGPARWCSADSPAFTHTDFDVNGRTDAVLAYTDGCVDHGNGVVVVFADGETWQLELDPTGQTSWQAQARNLGGDQYPDVETRNLRTGEVNYYHSAGDGTFVRGPDANTDRITLTSEKPVAIDVLANDYVASTARVVVVTPPRYGTIQVLSDQRIRYSPRAQHGRTDRFSYQVRRNGRRSTATVYLTFPG